MRTLVLMAALLVGCGGNAHDAPGDGQAGTCTTCAMVGATCGTISDNCGGTLQCGDCTTGETCGGNGTANVCGLGTCTPVTCTSAGKDCGQLSDGCSAVLQCGTCTGGETCGGGGQNLCGTGTCTPTTCAASGKDCGTITDGCSSTLACGACSGGEVCGAQTANVCGSACPVEGCPSGYTCSNATCSGGDPHGLDLDVKTTTLSGTVTLNGALPVATAACQQNDGTLVNVQFTNAATGVTFTASTPCTSNAWSTTVFPGTYKVEVQGYYSNVPYAWFLANPALVVTAAQANLVLDVKTTTASGTVTLNGAAPIATAACQQNDGSLVNVQFTNATTGVTFTASAPCTSNAWSMTIFPGTYKVEVQGYYSNVPYAWYLANPALVVTAAQANLALDVKTTTASGTVTLNGAAPIATAACQQNNGSLVNVQLTNATTGVTFTASAPCTSNAWSMTIFPGTYKVEVQGYYSNVPYAWYLANPALTVTAAQTNLALDVKTKTVSGTVTLNGAAPVATAACQQNDGNLVNVRFTDTTSGVAFSTGTPCTSNAWAMAVFPGTYKVEVQGYYSNVPYAWFLVNSTFAVSATQANLALDVKTTTVSGTVTLDGAAPVATAACQQNDGNLVNVRFTNNATGAEFSVGSPCTSNAWAMTIFPGTYKVEVQGYYSNVPYAWFVANNALVVTTAQANLTLDVKTVTVSGTVTLNGAVPVATAACQQNDGSLVNVQFTNATTGVTFTTSTPCTSNAWSMTIFPGVYKLEVQGYYSNVPYAWFLAYEDVVF